MTDILRDNNTFGECLFVYRHRVSPAQAFTAYYYTSFSRCAVRIRLRWFVGFKLPIFMIKDYWGVKVNTFTAKLFTTCIKIHATRDKTFRTSKTHSKAAR